MNDNELHPWLRRMMDGDPAAFREVYAATQPFVYRTVYYLSGNKDDVSDIVSEVYIALIQSLPSYRFEQSFRSWLNGITVRQVSNWRRKLWRIMRLNQRNRLLTVDMPASLPGERLFEAERDSELLQQVECLPAKLREVIVLRYYQECSYEEIAEALNVPEGTVKSRLHSAIAKLRSQIKIGEHSAIGLEGGAEHVHS
ncbi:sigma-70 family RNA polymerase sigma factor [Paenibacillus kobensis]|uniref:sigma-70 family RNA polymerase sigma factor n=1 Tax=Paenibacillus kobensis TaxID=59841 RepID=UPI001FE24D1A|nr:sigma-70 family RNA polymerase sigma factor [Paenibacillus kobensis]